MIRILIIGNYSCSPSNSVAVKKWTIWENAKHQANSKDHLIIAKIQIEIHGYAVL